MAQSKSQDPYIAIQLQNTKAALSRVDKKFLSNLTSEQLRELLRAITSVEEMIRTELRNCEKR